MNIHIRNAKSGDYKAIGIELQVNAKNETAYKIYANYGFTDKSITMELL